MIRVECPNCGNEMQLRVQCGDHKTCRRQHRHHQNGDYAVCGACGSPLRVEDGEFRTLVEGDRADLLAQPEIAKMLVETSEQIRTKNGEKINDIDIKVGSAKMGYYINEVKGTCLPARMKANALISLGADLLFTIPESMAEVPPDKALICVVQNGPFDAAALVPDDATLAVYAARSDDRTKSWLVLDRKTAYEAAGIKEEGM